MAVDFGFIEAELHHSHRHGDFNDCSTEDDSYNCRSGSSQNDDDHAIDVHCDVLLSEQWIGSVLVDQQFIGYWSAGFHE